MRAGSEADAIAVASSLMEATGAALHSGDFDSFSRCFHIPNTLATMDGIRHLDTLEKVRDTFDQIRAHYQEIGLSNLERRIAAALFDGPDLIRSCHVTRFVHRSGTQIKPTVAALGRLERFGSDEWKITGTQYSLHQDSDYGRALLGDNGRIEVTTAESTAAEAVFQNLLDTVTQAYLEGIGDLLFEAVQFPLFVQASKGTHVVNSVEELDEEFRRYRTQFLVHRVTDIVRRVAYAEQVGERRIQGGYRTHILSGDQLVIPSYSSAMTLEQGDDLKWRMTSVIHPMGHLTLEAKALNETTAAMPDGRHP